MSDDHRRDDAAFDEPVDLSALRSDDALLDAIGRAWIEDTPGNLDLTADERLAAVLLDWRRDIDSDPVREDLVTVEQAGAAIAAGRRSRRSPRSLAPVAAAAAFLVIAFSGVALGAHAAQPGDTLWPVTKVLYSEHAQTVEAVQVANSKLDEASVAIAAGKTGEASQALAAADSQLPDVHSAEDLTKLQARHDELMTLLASPPGAPAAPPASASSAALAPAPASAGGGASSASAASATSSAASTTPSSKPPVSPSSTPPPSSSAPATSVSIKSAPVTSPTPAMQPAPTTPPGTSTGTG